MATVNSFPSKYSSTNIGSPNVLSSDNILLSKSAKFVTKDKSSIPFPFAASMGFETVEMQ